MILCKRKLTNDHLVSFENPPSFPKLTPTKTIKDGTIVDIQGVCLIYGTGQNPTEAAAARKSAKDNVIAAGKYSDERGARPLALVERAREARPRVPGTDGYVKGEFPRHLVELSQERGLAAAGGNREAAPGAALPAKEVTPVTEVTSPKAPKEVMTVTPSQRISLETVKKLHRTRRGRNAPSVP